jgi:RNA polymerase sigma-70 factor (ECF subfamily)
LPTTGQAAPASEEKMTSDEALMLEFQQGSGEAFTELFRRYREPIYGFFRRRLQDPARAEELAQEAFLVILKSVHRYEPRALFRTYLYGIAVNMIYAERRKAGRQATHASEANAADAVPDPATLGDPDAGMVVRDAVGRLDDGEREVLLLREYEQLSYEEIAAVMRVPVNTVRSRLYRARMALRDLLMARRPQA